MNIDDINFDIPQPDPAWDYYAWWNWLHTAKQKIEQAITTIKDAEEATADMDEETQSLAQSALETLSNVIHS
jgi:hypothetical protein